MSKLIKIPYWRFSEFFLKVGFFCHFVTSISPIFHFFFWPKSPTSSSQLVLQVAACAKNVNRREQSRCSSTFWRWLVIIWKWSRMGVREVFFRFRASHTGRRGFKAVLPLVGHPKGNKCLAGKKSLKQSGKKLWPLFWKKPHFLEILVIKCILAAFFSYERYWFILYCNS